MKHQIEQANELADVTVVSLHFGNEYERVPNKKNRKKLCSMWQT